MRRTLILLNSHVCWHLYDVKTVEEIKTIARHERDVMVEHAAKLREMSIDVPTVSIGSTPTINHIDHLEGIDEVCPGNYIFFDNYQATLGSCSFDDTALTVLAAVVHRDASRRKIVIDAGGIAMSKDRGPVHLDPECGYGRVLDLDGQPVDLKLDSLSQEHGVMHAADDADIQPLQDRRSCPNSRKSLLYDRRPAYALQRARGWRDR